MTFMAKVRIAPPSVKLEDGKAEYMGEGIFVVLQKDATVRRHKRQNVVVSISDLQTLKASTRLTETMEDGAADYAGDGMWRLLQMDHEAARIQNVVLTGQDVEALLRAA